MKKFLFSFLLFFAAQAEDKHFVIDICSYNNAQWYERNLDSVLRQDYPHFRIIYTDDQSPDGTGDLVEHYLEEHDPEKRVLLIKNKERRRALANHYNAFHLCHDDEIILTLDGDDWLAYEQVLSELNELYNKQDIWFAYSRFENWPKKGRSVFGDCYSRELPRPIIEKHAIRRYTWVCGQLRTFYAWLAKCVKLEDLLLSKPLSLKELDGDGNFHGSIERLTPNQLKQVHKTTASFVGTFFPSACDVALMTPMLELAGSRVAFIDDPIYIRNLATDLNDHKVDPSLQNYCARYVRTLPEYAALNSSIKRDEYISKQQATMFVFPSFKNTARDLSFLYQLEGVSGIKQLDVPQGTSLKDYVVGLFKKSEPYILITRGESLDGVSITECIEHLEKTHAHAYFFTPPSTSVSCERLFTSDTFFWHYQAEAPRPGSALYRNDDIVRLVTSGTISTLEELWQKLPTATARTYKVGLFATPAAADASGHQSKVFS